MKVAIIAPPYTLSECPAPPLGVTYIAAAFEASGAEVKIIDYIVSRYSPAKLFKELDSFRPDVVGSTSVTLNFPVAAEILKLAKNYDPSIITVIGGPHVSFETTNTLKNFPEIDLIVTCEGEATVFELMSTKMDKSKWKGIKGIAFRDCGEVINTGFRNFIDDLDSMPLPSRHLLSHSRYLALGYPISIITSRGCPYSCVFCLGRRMVGKKVRRRSASLIANEIEDILSYGWTRINIADDLFTSSKQKVREVCEEIRNRGLKFTWSAFARVNTVDREMLELMKEAGCDSVSFGVESGHPDMLKRIKKNISLEHVKKAIALCKETGIIPHASFIAGLPGESLETLLATKEFARSLDLLHGYHFLTPFPGTTVREEIHKYDLEILSNDWTKYDANSAIVKTSALTPEAINKFVYDFENEIDSFWQKMLKGYADGTNSPEENMKVEGHFRTQLVYKLLSEDIIESTPVYPYKHENHSCKDHNLQTLCHMVAEKTGSHRHIVERALKDFADAGYIKYRIDGDRIVWNWTLNNKAG